MAAEQTTTHSELAKLAHDLARSAINTCRTIRRLAIELKPDEDDGSKECDERYNLADEIMTLTDSLAERASETADVAVDML